MKLYKDNSSGKMVQDIKGTKTIKEINKEFSGNFVEIQDSVPSFTQEEIDSETVENLIYLKIREIAIGQLKLEGKLTSDGKINK